MQLRPVARLLALITLLSQSAGELVIVPRDTESKVGDTTYFNCSTDLESMEIYWYHGDKYIYTGIGIFQPYNGRFEIERNASNGSHNLVIHSVKPDDAGTYICADDHGVGRRRSAELVVLDNDPECQSNIQPDGVIGQNVFGIPLDEIELTCNVSYHGNIPPLMMWKKVGQNSLINGSATSNNKLTAVNGLLYAMKLTGDIFLDNSSYICQTNRSTQNQYKCSSEIIKVLYFVGGNMIEQQVFKGHEITCAANRNTFSCINQWHYGNHTFNETITTQLLGEYLCQVKCHIRGTDYTFDALRASVAELKASGPEAGKSALPMASGTIAAVVAVVIIVIIAALISVLVERHKQMEYKRQMNDEVKFAKLQMDAEVKIVHDKFQTATEVNGVQHESKRKTEKVAAKEIELLQKIKYGAYAQLNDNFIRGIAILNELLFIAHENSSELEAYKFNEFHNVISIDVRELVDTYNMCSCKVNNCLYILDQKTNNATTPPEVLKIDTKGNVVGQWSTKNNAKGNMSITTEGHLIITVQENNLLLEYLPDGTLECEINLPNCVNPLHAIKREDRYIVCHGGTLGSSHRVCLVKRDGNVEKSFGCHPGSSKKQLHYPSYLAAGSSGCVIVADSKNNRLLLLDSKLEFKTKIVPKMQQRFLNPQNLSLCEKFLVVRIGAGAPYEAINEEERQPRNETNARFSCASIQSNDFVIEPECRILVFDIRPILQKYNGRGRPMSTMKVTSIY